MFTNQHHLLLYIQGSCPFWALSEDFPFLDHDLCVKSTIAETFQSLNVWGTGIFHSNTSPQIKHKRTFQLQEPCYKCCCLMLYCSRHSFLKGIWYFKKKAPRSWSVYEYLSRFVVFSNTFMFIASWPWIKYLSPIILLSFVERRRNCIIWRFRMQILSSTFIFPFFGEEDFLVNPNNFAKIKNTNVQCSISSVLDYFSSQKGPPRNSMPTKLMNSPIMHEMPLWNVSLWL